LRTALFRYACLHCVSVGKEVPLSDTSTGTDDIANTAQYEKNIDQSATVVSLADTQSLTIASIPILPAPQAISMAAVPIVATIVQNTDEDTGVVPHSRNARVIVRRRGRAKMIIQGTRISGSFGELVPNPKGPTFKRVRNQLFGTLLRSVGANKYDVVFDNGMERECASNSMKIVPKTAGLPPDDLESSESNPGGSNEINDSTIDETSQEYI